MTCHKNQKFKIPRKVIFSENFLRTKFEMAFICVTYSSRVETLFLSSQNFQMKDFAWTALLEGYMAFGMAAMPLPCNDIIACCADNP